MNKFETFHFLLYNDIYLQHDIYYITLYTSRYILYHAVCSVHVKSSINVKTLIVINENENFKI